LGIIDVVFDVASQLGMVYCAFVKWERNEAVHQLFLE